jgi:DNA adenine methylase (dam)
MFFESAIFYMGNKYKLLKYIIPLFPTECATFYDLFGGSGVVSMNYKADRKVYNEFNGNIVALQEMIKREDIEQLDKMYRKIVGEYGLRQKSSGDPKRNEQGFLRLRDEYNKSQDRDVRILFLLCCYSMNNIIRFNSDNEFNSSNGNQSYNKIIKNRLLAHHRLFQDVEIWNRDVFDIDFSQITEGDFVYLDPPYLNTTAVYNEKRAFGNWDRECDLRLFGLIDGLNERNVRFGMSNVFACRGKENTHLIEWCADRGYQVHHLDRVKYYPFSRGSSGNDEVYITNIKTKVAEQLTLF